jgi:ABC-type transporter Mla MlaB component
MLPLRKRSLSHQNSECTAGTRRSTLSAAVGKPRADKATYWAQSDEGLLLCVKVWQTSHVDWMVLDGDLDRQTGCAVSAAMEQSLSRRPKRLVINLRGLRTCDPIVLTELIAGYRGTGANSRVVTVQGRPPTAV